ncbi:MAG: Flp family type IVb pilin [Hyphomicrobiales bacterium]
MSKIRNWAIEKYVAVQARRNNEEGQGLAEYGLILALIAVVCIVALTALGGNINTTLGQINSAF